MLKQVRGRQNTFLEYMKILFRIAKLFDTSCIMVSSYARLPGGASSGREIPTVRILFTRARDSPCSLLNIGLLYRNAGSPRSPIFSTEQIKYQTG